jgi:UDP-N-acetylglucosamine 2-epimerase (non-hydrolysing)
VLIHTGQHYDRELWSIFVEELELEAPRLDLGIGSGSHAQQVARTVERLVPVLRELDPELVVVPGDVNSALGAALAAAQGGIPIAHIEAGLRSFDPTMPEELNRRTIDQLSTLLFIHSPEAYDNLVLEGIDAGAVHYVGNTMIDTLVAMRPRIAELAAPERHGVEPGEYVLATLHRPPLVDTRLLDEALRALEQLAEHYVVLFPMHPRTRAAVTARGLAPRSHRLRLLAPIGYLEFVGLLEAAAGVVTDSGGVQEEATFLGVPCFTLRTRTERPVTVELGTNTVLGLDPARIAEVPELIREAVDRLSRVPPLWDGRASVRIADVLEAAISWEREVSPDGIASVATPLEVGRS